MSKKRFTVFVMPNSKVLITADDDITMDEARAINMYFDEWLQDDATRALLIAGATVREATSVELDVPANEPTRG